MSTQNALSPRSPFSLSLAFSGHELVDILSPSLRRERQSPTNPPPCRNQPPDKINVLVRCAFGLVYLSRQRFLTNPPLARFCSPCTPRTFGRPYPAPFPWMHPRGSFILGGRSSSVVGSNDQTNQQTNDRSVYRMIDGPPTHPPSESRQVTPTTAGRSIATLICLRHTLRLIEPLADALEASWRFSR